MTNEIDIYRVAKINFNEQGGAVSDVVEGHGIPPP